VQLTLDAELQVLAQKLLAGVEGAAVVIDAATGEILVLASSPTFDPESLDEEWAELTDATGAPLLNRATQGLYQPGSVFHTIVLAEALAADAADLAAPMPRLDQPVVIDGVTVQCNTDDAGPGDLADAYARGCPSPIVDMAQSLGVTRIANAIARWGLSVPPSFEIPSAAPDWSGIAGEGEPLVAEALGQGKLVVSPMRVALVVATLGADGQPPDLHLVKRVQDGQGRWQELPRTLGAGYIVNPAVADVLLGAWTSHDGGRIISRSGTAIAGQDQPAHVWFTALSNTAGKRYAAVVLVEHAPAGTLDLELGRTLLRAALGPW
jgi:peptidoglycan glycosyltransferase